MGVEPLTPWQQNNKRNRNENKIKRKNKTKIKIKKIQPIALRSQLPFFSWFPILFLSTSLDIELPHYLHRCPLNLHTKHRFLYHSTHLRLFLFYSLFLLLQNPSFHSSRVRVQVHGEIAISLTYSLQVDTLIS